MKILLNLTLAVLVIFLFYSAWILYDQNTQEPISFTHTGVDNNIAVNYTKSVQFYPAMRFPSTEISYGFEEACNAQKRTEFQQALSIIASKTNMIFLSSSNPQIIVACSELAPDAKFTKHFVAGEGGPTEIINTTLFSVIKSGKISIYREERCNEPHIAIHEMFHVLGFDHSQDPNSIMYPTLDCDQTIDQYLIDDLNSLYSVPSLPDLNVAEATASKKRCSISSCVDFTVQVVNRGLKEADNVFLSIYSDDSLVKKIDMEDLDLGIRKTINVTNLVIPRKTDQIRFVVDAENTVGELYEDNNELGLMIVEN